jgi:hypothetical protein
VNTTPQLALSVQLPDDETFQSYQSQVNQPAVAQIINFVKQEFTDNSQKKNSPLLLYFWIARCW